MSNSLFNECTLTTDEFKRPKVLRGHDAISQLLVHIILLEPGTYSNRPTMGVGLVSKFRYITKDNLTELEDCIKDQINTFLPEFNDVSVKVDIIDDDDRRLTIAITVEKMVYKYETSKQNDNTISLTTMTS